MLIVKLISTFGSFGFAGLLLHDEKIPITDAKTHNALNNLFIILKFEQKYINFV